MTSKQIIPSFTFFTVICIVVAKAISPNEIEGREGIADDLSGATDRPKPGDMPVLNRKVTKGERVNIREHPYVASIRRRFSHYLVGAILTRNLVLTVAHPLAGVPVTELAVVLGENYSDRGSLIYTVLLVILHEDFDPYTLQDDIALLRLYEEIAYKCSMKPIALMSPLATLVDQNAFATGWGRCDNMGSEVCLARSSIYFPGEKIDPMLRTVTFKIDHPNNKCIEYKHFDYTIRAGMMCAGDSRQEYPACPCLGVPGALMVVNSRLLGLASWGFSCGYLYDLPIVYTNVQYYASWILNNIVILRTIKKNNLTALFEATKAYLFSEWLIKTRMITPELDIRSGKTAKWLDVDMVLAQLSGQVYDVRDFINNGAYHEDKLNIYNVLRTYIMQHPATPKNEDQKAAQKGAPFLGADALNEIGLDKDEIANFTRPTKLILTTESPSLRIVSFDDTNDDAND